MWYFISDTHGHVYKWDRLAVLYCYVHCTYVHHCTRAHDFCVECIHLIELVH